MKDRSWRLRGWDDKKALVHDQVHVSDQLLDAAMKRLEANPSCVRLAVQSA